MKKRLFTHQVSLSLMKLMVVLAVMFSVNTFAQCPSKINLLNTGSWISNQDGSSTIATSFTLANGQITCPYTVAKQLNDSTYNTYVTLIDGLPHGMYNLHGLSEITITYKSGQPLLLELPQPSLANSGESYQYNLSATGSNFVTLNIPISSFAQPSWSVDQSIPLALDSVPEIDIQPNVDVSKKAVRDTIVVSQLNLCLKNDSLVLNVIQPQHGSITVIPQQNFYKQGDTLTLVSSPLPGYYLNVWTGAVIAGKPHSAQISFIIYGNDTVSAILEQSGQCPDKVDLLNTGSLSSNQDGSSSIATSFTVTNGEVTCPYTVALHDTTFSTFVSLIDSLPAGRSMNGLVKITISYISDHFLLLELPTLNGSLYQYNLEPTGSSFVTVEIPFDWFALSNNPQYTIAPLQLDSVFNIIIQPNVNASTSAIIGTFIIRQLDLCGLYPEQDSLTLTIIPSQHGTVTASPQQQYYKLGNKVSLIAIPDSGYQLGSWTGAATGNTTDTIQIIMYANDTVSALFSIIPGQCPDQIDMLNNGKWSGSHDANSMIDSSFTVTNGQITFPYTIAKQLNDTTFNTFVSINDSVPVDTTTGVKNMNGLSEVTLTYSSDQFLLLELPQPNLVNANAYQFNLAPTGSSFITINIPVESFALPSGSQSIPLQLDSVKEIAIQPKVDVSKSAVSGTIFISQFNLCGLIPEVGITQYSIKNSDINIFGIMNGNLYLSVPNPGMYTIAVFTIEGKLIYYSEANLSGGVNNIGMNNHLCDGIYVIKAMNNQSVNVKKVAVTQ